MVYRNEDLMGLIDVVDCDLLYEEEDNEVTETKIPVPVSEELEQRAMDAFYTSMANFGEIRPGFMVKQSGASWEELKLALAGKVMWQDPEIYDQEQDDQAGWLNEGQYARGVYYRLRKSAEELNEKYDGRFETNLQLLERRKPEQLKPSRFILGDNRIPLYFFSRFICEYLGMTRRPKIRHSIGTIITEKESDLTFDRKKNEQEHGTKKVSGYRIWQMTLNGELAEAHKMDPATGNYIPDREESVVVQELQQQMIRDFEHWVHADPDVLDRLTEALDEKFCYLEEQYDGSWLTFPDLNPDIVLRPHQRNAVARTIQSRSNLLYAHSVGAGKRFINIVACHELKRMGLSAKNLHVIPNNVLDGTVRDHGRLYPSDHILKISPVNFRPKNREEMLQKIREEDYTAIYMAKSCFDLLKNSPEYYKEKTHQEICRCRAALATATMDEEKTYLKRTLKQLSERYKKLLDRLVRKETECYEQLGITTLFVDECHNYKNITLRCNLSNIVGMHAKGSSCCDEFLEKANSTPRKIFSTGTPLMNSLADLYVLQKFLQPEALEFCKIGSFGEWVKTFGEYQVTYEPDVDGYHGRSMTRLSRFHDLPQLMAMFRSVCDFYEVDPEALNLPKAKSNTVVVPKTPELTAAMQELAQRVELLRSRQVKRDTDNLLKITVDGRKIALDPRLRNPNIQVDDEKTKTAVCANEVQKLYLDYPGTAQIVFCDFSVPKDSFNIYDELKTLLIRRGIPGEEIAFIHDGVTDEKREQLLQDLNDGRIRIMVGSTQKLGTGVNAQESLIAVHHLDVPWRPGDLVQREGRLIRQGNRNRNVFIFRYVTEGSFDAYIWQILENKQRFICDFVAGRLSRYHSEEDNIDEIVLSYAEIKALAIGNLLLKKRTELSNQLERTRILHRRRSRELSEYRNQVYILPDDVARYGHLASQTKRDLEHYRKQKQEMDQKERDMFGEELLLTLQENEMQEQERLFDWYQGFELILPANMKAGKAHVLLRRKNGGTYSAAMEETEAADCCFRLDYVLEHLSERMEEYRLKYETSVAEYERAKAELGKGNPYEVKVQEMQALLEKMDEELNAA